MTAPRPGVGPAAGDTSPLVELDPLISCGAGTSATFEVFVTHRGPTTAGFRITVLGLDSRWVPPPLQVGPMEPGETTRITLSLVPERGTLGAKYPFVVAAEATPVSGGTVMGVAESTLAVDSRDPISMTLSPQSAVAVFSQRVKVQITNPGRFDRELTLSASAARGASLSLSTTYVTVPAGRTVTVAGKVRVTHPRFVGHSSTHTFAVAARGLGAPEFMEGTLRSKPLMGGKITGLLIAALVISIWAAAAIVGIPKLSNYFANQATKSAEATTQAGPGASTGASGSKGPGSSGAAGSGGSGSGGSGSGGSGSGSGSGGGAGGTGSGGASGGQLSGTITGTTPNGVQVSLEPATLVEASAAGAQPAPGATDAATANALRSMSTGAFGKVPADALRLAPAGTDSGIRTTKSAADGSFSFSGVGSSGYFLLILAKPGYATQRFVVNAATLDAATPIKVALVPGDGSMSGMVTSTRGPVGAASVTITDGTVSLQTSSVSAGTAGGTPGSWTVKGLSTPGTYLITVTAAGFGAESTLVKLAAGGTGKADLALKTGVAAIDGKVSGVDDLGRLGGLGGITVTASGTSNGVAATRTATTVTSGPVGTFDLPDLPTPGDYTVTVSGPGYATQTQQVSLAEGSSSATVNISLTKAYGTVSGSVVGDGSEGGLIGAGLTLTGSEVSYKTMTTSAPAGAFRFTGIPPGTYVLQASQYGRLPASATVVVTAAGSTTATLHLVGAPGSELPATAHIRGRAVDARTQSPITCDRSATPVPAKNCLVTATTPVPLDPAKGTAGGTEPALSLSDSAGNYTLPSVTDTKHPGLVAGLYQVTLSAPGYEPTTISVQVAQGQTVPAPQVSLSPLGLINGTITTHVGTPVTPSCVVSVPAGTAIPASCTPTSATACTVPGSPTARCSLTAADGTYEIRGLVHGGYTVVVLPTDPEYLPSQPLAVQLDLGSDFRFDTALDRLGRATVTVLQANPLTLALSAAKGAAVQVVDANGIGHGHPLAGDSTSDDGTLTITGLLGSYTAKASGDVSTGGTSPVTGSAAAPTGDIALNQTVAVTMVLTAPIGAVVGHVTVAVDGVTQDVAGATVQVTGIVGFTGRNTVSGTVSVTTDSNGCYAIIPAVWDPTIPLRSADCPSVVTGRSVVTITDTAGNNQSLVALPLAVNVAQLGQKTQSYSATGVVITGTGEVRAIPPINLLAQPSAVPVLTLTLRAPAGIVTDASKSTIVVTRKPAGAGNITVTAAPNGTLTWTDSNLGTGKAVPGLYRLTSTNLGYASSPVSIWCGLGEVCRFGTQAAAAESWFQDMLPTISGTISVQTPPGLPDKITLDQAVVTVISQPTAAGSLSVTVDKDGKVTFRDLALQISGLPGNLAQPTPDGAPYQFSVSLPGYSSGPISVNCGPTFRDGCNPLSTTLKPLPRFSGTVETTSTIPSVPPNDFTGLTVSFTAQPNPTQPVAVTVEPDGQLTWKDPTQPAKVVSYGDYTMVFAKPGYQSVTQAFSCTPADCTFNSGNPVMLTMFAAGGGTVSVDQLLPGTTSVDWTKATVTLTNRAPGSEALGISVVQDPSAVLQGRLAWNDGSLPFSGITRSGTYALTVTLPGYGAGSSGSFTCTAGQTGLTACGPTADVALGRLPGFAGTVQTQTTVTPDNSGGLTGVTATVTAQPNPASRITVGINTATGALSWSDSSQPAGIAAPGTYTVLFAKNGFESVNATFTCSTGTCGPGTVTLREFPPGTGVVSVSDLLPGTTTVDWSKATVSLTTQPPGSAALSIGLVSSGSTTANLTWRDSSLPDTGVAGVGLTRPGTYVIVVSLPGFGSQTSAAFTCSAGATSCQPAPALRLSRLPGVTGSVTITPTIDTNPVQGLDGITVAVNSQPNPKNPVVVTVDATTGAIQWNDPSQPPGVVTAGAYSLTFAKPGYASVSTQFSCATGATSCDIGTIALLMNPHGTGSVSVSALAPNTTSVDWTKATVTLVNQPPNTSGLGVSLVQDGADPKKANFAWADSAQPYAGLTLPGSYTIRVTLPGYGSATSAAFTCHAGDRTCGPDLTLNQQPTFTGTVVTDPAGGSLVGAVVSVTSPAGVNAVTTTVAADGTIAWQEAGAPAGLVSYGTYQISASLTGYLSQSVTWICSAVTCPPLTLTLTAPSTLQLTVTSASGGGPINAGTFDLTGTLITGSTVNGPTNSNVVSFPGLSPLGDYSVTVHAAGFANGTFNKTTTAVICTDSSNATHTGLRVWPGGVTSCAVTLNPLGSISMKVTGVTRDANNAVTSSVTLAGAAVSVQRLSGGSPTGPVFSAPTTADGTLVITGTNAAQGLVNGTWRVTAAQDGYTTRVGTVVIAATTYDMVADTGATALPIVSGVLQVQLNVNPVALQVHLTVNGAEVLPAVTVALAGGPTPLACTITTVTATTYKCAETSKTGSVVNGTGPTGKYVNFATVSPGIYTVSVTSATSSYRTVTLQAQVVAGLTPQQLVLSLDERSSTQSGTMSLADGTHPAGITATLRTQQNIAVIAKDQNGQPLSVQTDSSGLYHFVGVPDGQYTLVGEYPGYAFAQFGTTVVMNSALTSTPPDLANLQLTSRATTPVTLNITSTAKPATGTAVSLSGASVVLTPPTNPITGLPADAAQTVPIPPGTGPSYAVTLPQLATGTWGVSVTAQNNAPFAGVLNPDSITVAQPPVTSGAIPTQKFPLVIEQSLVALTVTFANNSCITAPTSLELTLTKTGTAGSQTLTAPVVVGASTSTATAKVYLPQGSYSFVPTVDPTDFTATATPFTVGTPAPSNSEVTPAPTVDLSAKLSPLDVSMTVDGSGASAGGFVVTVNGTPTSGTLDGAGKETVCLKPATTYTISIGPGATGQKVSVPGTSVLVSATAPNPLPFTAFTVTPSVALQAVAGRVDPAAITVPVVIERDGTTIYSGSAVGVTQTTPASAPTVVLGQCTGCAFTLTATPPTGGVFGAVTGQPFTPATTTVTATLPYTAAMATVTVTHGANVVTKGATVTIAPPDKTAPVTDANGKTIFQDLTTRQYVFTADWIDQTDPLNPIHYSGTVTKTLTAGANPVPIPMTVVP